MDTIAPVSIRITDDAFNECLELYDRACKGKDDITDFREFGGLIIGRTDGRNFSTEKLFFDQYALSTTVSINFSNDLRFRAEQWIEKVKLEIDDIKIIGTWHVHPPGTTAQYSITDERSLFQEKMLLYTDEPLAEWPRIHVIFDLIDREKPDVKAYIMKVNGIICFSSLLKKIELESEIKMEIEKQKKQTGIYGIHKVPNTQAIYPYHPEVYRWESSPASKILGFWRFYSIKKVIPQFERIFLENFFYNTGLCSFIYSRITKPVDQFVFENFIVEKYENIKNSINTSFQEIKVIIKGEEIER